MKKILLGICCAILLFACKEKQNSSSEHTPDLKPGDTTVAQIDTTALYFSVKEYFDDQWKTRKGNPYALLRIIEQDNSIDSAFINLDEPLWEKLRAPFDAADISHKKFLGKYKYQEFTDQSTETLHLYYEAMHPELMMQKMDISVNNSTNLVKGVYIETVQSTNDATIKRKLNYVSDRVFQYIDFMKKPDGTVVNMVSEYKFSY